MSEASLIHEALGHLEGRGAGYDLVEALKGHFTPVGESAEFWRPSEVYAYSTQPARTPTGELDEDLRRVGVDLLNKPDLLSYYLQHRNPQSDWPTTREGFRELGLVNSVEALEAVQKRLREGK
jgi:hypothetical protein